jgi:hypothetical protein
MQDGEDGVRVKAAKMLLDALMNSQCFMPKGTATIRKTLEPSASRES